MTLRFSNRTGNVNELTPPEPDTHFKDPNFSYAPHAFWF